MVAGTNKAINQNIQIYEKKMYESFSAKQKAKKTITNDETNGHTTPGRVDAGFGNGLFAGYKI